MLWSRASADAATAIISQVMFSSKSRGLRKLSCGAGVKDTRQLPYTSFLRFDTGRPEETPDTEKANHSKVHQSPRGIIHKTGWTYRRKNQGQVAYCRLYGAGPGSELHCAKPLIIPIGKLRKLGIARLRHKVMYERWTHLVRCPLRACHSESM